MPGRPDMLSGRDGSAIAYHRSPGTGPGVLFLPGFMSNMEGAKATALETWCRTHGRAFLRFDYFGHGQSGGRFEDGSIGRWTEDVTLVLDRLTDGPQILVGSSMGGWLMLLTALARPGRIAGLLGIAPAPDLTEKLLWRQLSPSDRERIKRLGKIWQTSAYSQSPYTITWQLIVEGRNHLLLDRQIPVSSPVRLLHGMRDVDVPWEISLRLAERLAGDDVRVILVKDGDHRLSRTTDILLLIETLLELSHAVTCRGQVPALAIDRQSADAGR